MADQGNRRVQVFAVACDGSLTWQDDWPVDGWKTNTVEYKPFLCFCRDHCSDPNDRIEPECGL